MTDPLRYLRSLALLAIILQSSAPPTPVDASSLADSGPATAEREVVPDKIIVRLREGASQDLLMRQVVAWGAVVRTLPSPPALSKRKSAPNDLIVLRVDAPRRLSLMSRLSARSDVRFAAPVYRYRPLLVPNDPYYASQSHHPLISSPEAWSYTTGSTAMTIAVLDTGVDATHPDLAGKLLPGYNFHDGNADSSDPHGHGTAVAGTAAAISNNAVGVAGVASANPILPVRISDASGSAYTDTIANAIRWASDQGAMVINISFGPLQGDIAIESAAQYARSRGALIFAAAGNDGRRNPSSESTAIAFVSATEGNDTVASWSSTGPAVKLAAPGYRILTTARGGGYSYYSGTSFSSPMAAGLAALTWSAAPGLSASALEEILFSTAKDLGTKGRDEMYGHGRIQALAAVQRAVQLGGAAPAVKLKLPVAGDRGRGTLPVEVVATSQVAIAQVSLLVDGRTVATKSSSPYRFDWDTSNLAAGTHILNASARNAVGTVGWSGAVDVIVDNTTLPHAAPSGPPDGAVLAFSVGEGSGQTVFDASAFENDGILGTSTEAEWEDPSFANGRVGNALLFDGMNDLVTVPDSPSLRITGPITLEAWVWWEPTTQWQPIVARSNWPQRAFGLYVHESRVLHMSYVSSTGKVGAVQSGPGTVPVRQWVHLAGTIDPIGSSMRIYVNGFEVARAPAAGALSPMPGLPLQLGISDASQQDTCRPFKGRLDDVAVLGRLLSADEVATRAGLDRTAPTVRVDSPSNGTAVSGPVTASASAWDASGLRSLRLFVDDLEIGAGNGAPLAVSWDPAAFPGGPHTLRARAVDLNGNEGFSPTVTVTVSHPGAELPDAVLIYHMSEGAGQTTVDSGGIGNTGQLGSLPGPDGADPIWGAGRSGPGLVFDGVDDLVRAVDSSSLRVRQGLTLEAWVWWEPTAQWQPIVARSSWPRRAYGLYLHQSRLLHLSYVSSTGQVGAVQTAGSVVPARQWVHVAGTIDPAANLMTLLVNGVEVARAPAAGWLAEASGLPLQLGMADPSQPDSCRPFKGVLDEVGVYSRPLSTAEIAARAAVDRLPPVVRIDSPADGSTVAGAVTIQASASDNTTVATVRLLVDDVEVGSGSGGTARVVWDTRTCPNGTHAVRARAVDPAGNEAQSTPVSVTVANAAAELPGAVLIYHMSEESGRTAVDSSGHDNPGELGSDSDDDEAEPDRGAGRSGGGLIFDGKDDLVRVKESSSLRLRQAVTLEAWIWWEPTSQWQPIIARSDWPRRAFGLYLHESRLINLSYVSAAGNVAAIQSAAGVVPARQWVHVAGTIDTVAGAMRLYVNGIEVARGSSADSLAEAPGLPVQLGAADAGYPASCRPFKGALDEVVIYNRALSASEVAGRWAGR